MTRSEVAARLVLFLIWLRMPMGRVMLRRLRHALFAAIYSYWPRLATGRASLLLGKNEKRRLMALKVDPNKTYEKVLKDPDEGTEYKVSYRKLTHGEIEERRKVATKVKGKGRKAQIDYDSKAANYWAVKRSIVSWDIPFGPTPEELEDTESWLLQQVYGHLADLNPPLATELRAFLDDDEDEDETDDEDPRANVAAIKANGHNSEEQQQTFTEDSGPTSHAATS